VDYDEDMSEADWHADRNAGRWEAIVARQRARIEQLEAELKQARRLLSEERFYSGSRALSL
jgi:hypothetical protein